MGNHDFHQNDPTETLVKLLKSIDRPGDFCVGGKLDVPMPRVTVDGVGDLSFPVPQVQIDALIEKAERAPYGKGTKTLMDSSVRDCWQIDAKQVRLAGRTWPDTFKKIMDIVSKGLGLGKGKLDAQLYKLLVYGKGGFFAAHRDTEKVNRMIATLSLSLPTPGEGGAIAISHQGRELVFNMNAHDPSELSYAAFYADCLHEARPVTKGHKISLVFNLHIRSGKKWSGAPDYSGLTEKVKACLADWRDHAKVDKMVWLLDHSYSVENLSFDTLKGTDAVVAKVLGEAADSADCDIHAAALHIEEVGDPVMDYDAVEWGMEPAASDTIEELHDRREYLSNWIDRDGSHPPFGELSLDDGELLIPDALEHADPDERLFEEYQGNYGPTLELFYRIAALVTWPKAKTVKIVAGGGIKHAVDWAEKQCDTVSNAQMRQILSELVDLWPEKHNEYRDYNRAGMLRLLGVTGSADLATDFLDRIVINQYDGSENESLANLNPVIGPEVAKNYLPRLVEKYMPQRPKEVVSLLALTGETISDAGPDWLDVQQDVARSAVSRLRAALECSSEALATRMAYRISDITSKYISKEALKQLSFDSAAIRNLFALVCRLNLDQESIQAANIVAEFPTAVTPDRMLPEALEGLYKIEYVSGTEAYRLLWRQSVDFLIHRSSVPPSKPSDWTIDTDITGTSELINELRAFCLDPKARVKRFRVATDLRKHLHTAIENHQLDMTHVTERKGRPYTLVCTKNRASYVRRKNEYAEDLRYMDMLLKLVPKDGGGHSEGERVRRLEAAREAFNSQ